MSGYTDLNNYELKSKNGLTIHQMTTSSKTNGIKTDTIDGCINKTTVSFKKNNGSNGDIDNSLNPSFVSEIKNENEKSFVEQRIERLYGRGLLLEEFHRFKRRSSSSSPSPRVLTNHKDNLTLKSPASENNFASTVSTPPALPVFKHLSPEFRAQLAVNRDRKPRNALLEKDSNIIANGNGFVNGGGSGSGSSSNTCRKSIVKTITTINGTNSLTKMSNESEPNMSATSTSTTTTTNNEKGPNFFLNFVASETERLLQMATEYENYLNDPEQAKLMSEETSGFIRTTIGQARLLTAQKFEQFRGLCRIQLQERKLDELPLETNDLAGFWDMIALQVAQLDSHFNRLHTIKNNNWIYLEDPEKKKNDENGKTKKVAPVTKSLPTTTTSAAAAAAAEAETRKKNLEEQRQKFRAFRQKAKAAIVNSPEKSSSDHHSK